MFTKLLANKILFKSLFNTNKVISSSNYNYLNYCSFNRWIFTSINSRNETKNFSFDQSQNSSQSIDYKTRKIMTKFIRQSLPVSANVAMDWDRLRRELKMKFNLNEKDFKQIIIPIVSHSVKTHTNTLISIDNYLRPSLAAETDPLILTYHFLLLSKIIEKCSHFSDEDNRMLSEKLLKQILCSSTDQLESGVITRIIVIIRDCLLSLANSSVYNCVFAVNLWTIVLNIYKDSNSDWRKYILRPDTITAQLIDLALEKSLRSEAIELAKVSYDLVSFKFTDSNIEIWLKILLRLNSNEENIKLFETLKFTESKISIKFLRETQLLLDRMGYECKIARNAHSFEIVDIWSKSNTKPLTHQQ